MADSDADAVVMIDYGGIHTFELHEPDAEVLLRIVNTFSAIGRRAQAHVQKVMRKPTMAGLVWSLGEVLTLPDLERLGSAVLQFETDREGRKWLKEHGVKIGPIIRALIATLRASPDLVDALQAVGEGIGALEGAVQSADLEGLLSGLTGDDAEDKGETAPEA